MLELSTSISFRFTLPPFLTLKNFEGLDLGKMDMVSNKQEQINYFDVVDVFFLRFNKSNMDVSQAEDSGLASYVAGQIDRTLSWKVCKIQQDDHTYFHFLLNR